MRLKKITAGFLVFIIMITGLLAITNPGRKRYNMFDKVEGQLTHDYFIFSIYQQYSNYSLADSGKYRVYKRYLGIAMNFYEIRSLKVKQDPKANDPAEARPFLVTLVCSSHRNYLKTSFISLVLFFPASLNSR
jgi:hypothetical protein